ncbi:MULTISPECIES: hypothetical protein [unclassified Bosea (in: a-proteobacteria)]|uniref:hypothetical protein n=1 Tax=unclassified Bosea (in: a-proteobacteria) TaxID=2653178 RepID=UPI000F7E99D2|nr:MULTISPECIES: hypothetical protein [unclassified Bosea (in: a-proteobacteria)]
MRYEYATGDANKVVSAKASLHEQAARNGDEIVGSQVFQSTTYPKLQQHDATRRDERPGIHDHPGVHHAARIRQGKGRVMSVFSQRHSSARHSRSTSNHPCDLKSLFPNDRRSDHRVSLHIGAVEGDPLKRQGVVALHMSLGRLDVLHSSQAQTEVSRESRLRQTTDLSHRGEFSASH